ncbi:hypothetical protein [Microbispora sp. H10885]|uniref:hypothetical protein n=1 Tax=Microbispora sp. H10885 TaxID=2729110 RepID=UPI001C728534|nr:hypothetical protein [Microbispora sp. H10885]
MIDHAETVTLSSQGLSAWIAQDRKILAMFQVFHSMGADFVIGANTIVETSHARVDMPRLHWALARAKVEPASGPYASAYPATRRSYDAAPEPYPA